MFSVQSKTNHYCYITQLLYCTSRPDVLVNPPPPSVVVESASAAVLAHVQKDFKSPWLQSALQRKPSPNKQAGDESDGQPPAKRKKIDLIFKDILLASLEDSDKPSLPEFNSVSLPKLKVEEKEDENLSSEEPSTSFCPNCVRLKRRILELEEELFRLKGEQGDTLGPSVSEQSVTQNNQVRPHPEQGPIEDFQGRETL